MTKNGFLSPEMIDRYESLQEDKDYFEDISIFTAAMGFSQKLDLLSALYLKRYSSNKKQCEIFNLLIRKLYTFERQRNTWVHSRWGTHTMASMEVIRSKPNIRGGKVLKNHSSKADYDAYERMKRFSFIGMGIVFRGCKEYVEMSEEDALLTENNLTN